MLNNNPFFKENKIHIIRIIIMSVIGIGAILADLKFEIMNNSLNELIKCGLLKEDYHNTYK